MTGSKASMHVFGIIGECVSYTFRQSSPVDGNLTPWRSLLCDPP